VQVPRDSLGDINWVPDDEKQYFEEVRGIMEAVKARALLAVHMGQAPEE